MYGPKVSSAQKDEKTKSSRIVSTPVAILSANETIEGSGRCLISQREQRNAMHASMTHMYVTTWRAANKQNHDGAAVTTAGSTVAVVLVATT
jgi:hypothetical protein